jgi:hypothetical protein
MVDVNLRAYTVSFALPAQDGTGFAPLHIRRVPLTVFQNDVPVEGT